MPRRASKRRISSLPSATLDQSSLRSRSSRKRLARSQSSKLVASRAIRSSRALRSRCEFILCEMARMAASLSVNSGGGSELMGTPQSTASHGLCPQSRQERLQGRRYPVDQAGEIWREVLITGGLLTCRGMGLSVHYLVVRWGNSPTEADRGRYGGRPPVLRGTLTASAWR